MVIITCNFLVKLFGFVNCLGKLLSLFGYFFLITCIKGKCILVISYVFLVNIKNGFLLSFFVVFNKCLSNAQHNEICQYCRNQIMGLFFLMGV